MVKDPDIVRWMLDRMLELDPRTAAIAETMEAEVRGLFGGREVRVWRTPSGRVGRPPAAVVEAMAVVTSGRAATTGGIDRAGMYRLMKPRR